MTLLLFVVVLVLWVLLFQPTYLFFRAAPLISLNRQISAPQPQNQRAASAPCLLPPDGAGLINIHRLSQ